MPVAAPGAPAAVPPAAAGAVPGPQGSPMAQPSSNEGNKQMGMVMVEAAMSMLSKSLVDLFETPEGEAVNKALAALSKHFGSPKTQELIPAQIMQLAQAQMPSPQAQAMAGPPGGQPSPQPGVQ